MNKIIPMNKRNKVIIVAEISANHGQSLKCALSLIKKAKESGADAVKFQTYTQDTLTINCNNKHFQIKHPRWGGQTLYQLYKKAATPWSWFKELKRVADDLGLIFFSTAFDRSAVDFLEALKVPVHKTASFELVDLPLIEYMANTKKPIIISTGMGSIGEITQAVLTAREGKAKEVMLLKCVSAYPADPSEMNLNTIIDMKNRFHSPVGLSDHTLGFGVAVASIALGVKLIEKHFILSRKMKTPDSFFSLEPLEFKELVRNVRIAEGALGRVHYGLTTDQVKNKMFRRSLFIVQDMKAGDIFNSFNMRSIRPGYGMHPGFYYKILGKKARKCIKAGTPLVSKLVA